MEPSTIDSKVYEEIDMPVGGIANFYFSDIDERDDDDNNVDDFVYGPQGGLHDLKPVAEKLASFGRFGDDNIAHVETGEFIVPTNVQEENPELMEKLRNAIEAYGVSADRYVVGSQDNMINPVTGQPEFFKIFKKIFKKVTKAVKGVVEGVKKVVKKIGKVLKPIAGTIATVALTPVVGPIAAGAIGGGIQGLVDGKGVKGALKGALVGGVTAGIFSGVKGAYNSIKNPNVSLGQGFMSGVRDGFGSTQVMNSFAEKIMPNVPTSGERLMMIANPGMTTQQAEGITSYMNEYRSGDAFKTLDPNAQKAAEKLAMQDALKSVNYAAPTSIENMSSVELSKLMANNPKAYEAYKQKMKIYEELGTAVTPEQVMKEAIQQTGVSTGGIQTLDPNLGQESFLRNADGSFKVGKAALISAAALPVAGAAMGAFDPIPAEELPEDAMYDDVTEEEIEEVSVGTPEEEEYTDATGVYNPPGDGVGQPTGGDSSGYSPLIPFVGQPGSQPQYVDYGGTSVQPNVAYNPDLMGSFNNSVYYPSQYQTIPGYNPQITGMSPAPFYGFDEYGRPIYSYYGTPDVRSANFVPDSAPNDRQFVCTEDVRTAAVGGPMTMQNFPRRSGMIEGRGTETSDDIPAMLSDGEFVMTARAVRGAGGGDRQQGFRKMYDIMRAFEGGVVT